MSTLGSLMALLSDPGIQPYNAQELTENRLRLGNVTNQTELLRLAELKRQQEAEALVRAQVQNDPRVREMLFGGGGMPQSLLGSLQAPAPPPGALTQRPMPGMPGQAQSIPAYPDASRYASVPPASGGPIPPELAQQMLPQVTRPQSTLGGIGAQPQANPLLEMASRNPDAALLLQKQMLQQEDTRYKIQERQLDWRSKQAGYIGSTLQGATDQASYDTARDEIARVFPEWGARLPATYSKEAVQPFIDRALSVREKALLDSETLKTQVDIAKYNLQAAQSGYQGLGDDRIAILKGLTDEQVKAFGGRTSPQAIAYANQEANRVALQKVRETGAAQAGEQPLSDTTAQTVTALRRGESLAHQLLTEFTPEERAKFVGMGGMRMRGQQLQAWLRDATKTGADPRYARFLTLLSEGENEAFATGGKALSKQEADVVFGYIPTGKETSVAEFESKLQQAKDRATTRLDETLTLATTPKRALAGERESGSLARPGQAAARAGTTTGSKGTVKMETIIEYVDKQTAAGKKLTLGQAIRQAYDKGLEIE